MCNLYSMTKTQDAMRQLFRFTRDRAGNCRRCPESSLTRWRPLRLGEGFVVRPNANFGSELANIERPPRSN
jgi:hypothetical protein